MKVHRGHTTGSHRVDTSAPATKVAEEQPAAAQTAFTGAQQHVSVQKAEGQVPSSRVRLEARKEATVFDGWLKVHQFSVKVTRGGVPELQRLNLLQRPGHDSTHTATVKLHGEGPPTIVYKDGDTRPAAALRGTPYVATGIVAGSLDHEGVDAEATALLEIAEEVGGKPLGKLVKLGDAMPTMPVTDGDGDIASSESDNYWLGVLGEEQVEITGDGGGLEVLGLMKPIELSISDAIAKIDSGGIRENARARVALQRGLDKLGFVPQLNAWVRDLPPALRDRFENLGLGDTYDPRGVTTPDVAPAPDEPHAPAKPDGAPPQNMHLAAKVSDVDLGLPKSLELSGDATMIDSTSSHLADDGTGKMVPVGKPARIQTLHTEHDRLKLAQFYVDPKLGPMVRLELAERPIIAAKNALTGGTESALRQDVTDLRVPLPKVTVKDGKVVGAEGLDEDARAHALKIAQAAAPGAKVAVLSAPSYASPGQSDLRYHFVAAEVDAKSAGAGFVPLGEALRRMRSESAGDANTEALLQRLADHLQWIPQLGMSVSQATGALAGA